MPADPLFELIRLAYESAANPRLWPVFLEKFAEAVKASAAAFIVQDFRKPRGNASAHVGYDVFWEKRYADYYGTINPWTQAAPHLFTPGNVLICEQFLPSRELVKTEFYNDFLRPQNHFYSFGCAITEHDSTRSYITALRPQAAGGFGETEAGLLSQLYPHLEAALRVHERIAGLEARVGGMTEAMDQLGQGVMLVDAEGRVGFANRYAERILTSGDGLAVVAGALSADRPDQTRALRHAIAHVASGGNGKPMRAGIAFRLDRRSARASLRLFVAPAVSVNSGLKGRPSAVVFLTDPEQVPGPDAGVLEQLLDLTPAEARLATALVQGKTLQQFAGEAGVTLNTVRTHLKRMFSKTGVGRQSDLVRLVLAVAPQIPASISPASTP